MDAKKIGLQEFLQQLDNDKLPNRFVARVIFVNDLNDYKNLIDALSSKVDIVLHLSDKDFCKGEDTIPDMHSVIDFLDKHTDKDILIPNLAEYMRIGEVVERQSSTIYSLLNRHVHSKARVLLPLLHAKTLFEELVGSLPEERFGDALYELDGNQSEFSAYVYSKDFSSTGICNARGIREWLQLWDSDKITSGMSFSTRLVKQIKPSMGGYNLKIIVDPYDYIVTSLKEVPAKLSKDLGSSQNWADLINFVCTDISMRDLLLRALNVFSFNTTTILHNWNTLSEFNKWVFWLWYKLDLYDSNDYISYAVSRSSAPQDILNRIELEIFNHLDAPNFDEWNETRKDVLKSIGKETLSDDFWIKFDALANTRLKLKMLSSNTLEERWHLLKLVSELLKKGESLTAFDEVIRNVCPALNVYLQSSKHIGNHALSKYIFDYKQAKIADKFSFALASQANDISKYDFDSRSTILNKIKNPQDCYFLWIDGMGVEWIDLLLYYIKKLDPAFPVPQVSIGYAFIPTVTKVNMDKTLSDFVTRKINDFDDLSHIKNKSNCNYQSVVAQQFDLMEKFAEIIVDLPKAYPNKDIVVTADHGMSRMAALGFHNLDSVSLPAKAQVCNLGRYCELVDCSDDDAPYVPNTEVAGNIIAFRNHQHFTCPGNAPGEIHGGCTPEELYVPIIRFGFSKDASKQSHVSYTIKSHDVYRGFDGNVCLEIETLGDATGVKISINGQSFDGVKKTAALWNVVIPGLNVDTSYNIRVFVNNRFPTKTETITVKRRGITKTDDDF